jgi:two-component system CheB/CheR fusion protein
MPKKKASSHASKPRAGKVSLRRRATKPAPTAKKIAVIAPRIQTSASLSEVAISDPISGIGPEFMVVGIGASAGGLEACTLLLGDLPRNPGMALIVVQHLSPDHGSMLPELLARATPMSVVSITDGMALEMDQVYVMPPNTQLAIIDGTLRLFPRPEDGGPFMPIDYFFRSLADYAQSKAVGIVLSGTASDGAVGLREIRGAGGITMAQDPRTARYDGMPRAAIAMDVVDVVLPAEHMARELIRIRRHPFVARRGAKSPDEMTTPDENLKSIFLLLRRSNGIDFTHYKYPTIKRRLQRRMLFQKLTTLGDYLKFLQATPAEVKSLHQDLLIHVTRFFREPNSFKLVSEKAFPRLMEGRAPDAPLRFWIPGCATGEEAYSMAITLLEFMDSQEASPPVQIFATDASETAIVYARQGLYPESISADVSAERLRKHFSRADGGYRVAKRVRDMCIFARQDLTQDPPFSTLDMIMCRNVLIYLGAALQNKLINLFHYALKPVGFLALGAAETVGTHTDLFAPLDRHCRIYTKRITGLRNGMEFPHAHQGHTRLQTPVNAAATATSATSVESEASRIILSRYSPAGVIVDAGFQILQFRGQTGPFLEPAPGEASLNLLKMLREGLLHGVRAALAEARKTGNAIRKDGLLVPQNGTSRRINLHVIPLTGGSGTYLILFEDAGGADNSVNTTVEKGRGGESRTVKRLRNELAASRDFLQTIIQDLEAANEELQSANEEILSRNEELQSTNEELDTAKEELQSTNEELNTVNDELQGRNEELSRVNSDLTNLIGSMPAAIVMVTADLRIRRFTPMAEKLMNLIPADIGRSLATIQPSFDCPNLEKLLTECVDTMTTKELEVRDRAGRWYSLHIRPYKNIDNRIDGGIISIFDVDATHRLQESNLSSANASVTAMLAARDYAEAMVNTVPTPFMVLHANLQVKTINKAFSKYFGIPFDTAAGQPLDTLGSGSWNIPPLIEKLKHLAPGNDSIEGIEVEGMFPRLGRRRFLVNVRRMEWDGSEEPLVLLAMEDVTSNGSAWQQST